MLFAWYLDIRAQSHSVCLILWNPGESCFWRPGVRRLRTARWRETALWPLPRKKGEGKNKKKWENWKALLSQIYVMCVGDGWQNQNGWIFGKNRNGLWPPPLTFGKSYCKSYCKPCIKAQNLQYKFLDWKWPPLELFQKFIRFGIVICPLFLWVNLTRRTPYLGLFSSFFDAFPEGFSSQIQASQHVRAAIK